MHGWAFTRKDRWMEKRRHDRQKNYTTRCRTTVDSMGDYMADLVWENWNQWYTFGEIPQRVCALAASCNVTDPLLNRLEVL
jgi:hypothetical protein